MKRFSLKKSFGLLVLSVLLIFAFACPQNTSGAKVSEDEWSAGFQLLLNRDNLGVVANQNPNGNVLSKDGASGSLTLPKSGTSTGFIISSKIENEDGKKSATIVDYVAKDWSVQMIEGAKSDFIISEGEADDEDDDGKIMGISFIPLRAVEYKVGNKVYWACQSSTETENSGWGANVWSEESFENYDSAYETLSVLLEYLKSKYDNATLTSNGYKISVYANLNEMTPPAGDEEPDISSVLNQLSTTAPEEGTPYIGFDFYVKFNSEKQISSFKFGLNLSKAVKDSLQAFIDEMGEQAEGMSIDDIIDGAGLDSIEESFTIKYSDNLSCSLPGLPSFPDNQ